jgi:hypothetical protein
MTPTCSNAAMRVLISVLLASTVANAAALPHQVVDARAPAPIQNAELAAQAIQAAASAAAENPENFFEDVSDGLNHRTGWEVFRDFFTRLFGPREGDGEEPAEVTVTVTASAEVTVSAAPATTTLEIVLPSIPLTTGVPESEIIFSILPVGDLTSMINATVPTPIFLTATNPAATTSALAISAPFPVLNGTASDSILPTAAIITGEFSVTIPLVTGIPSPVNSTIPEGTGIALPTDANLTEIIVNATNTETVNIATTIVVTETVTPVLLLTTGTAVSASAGLPIPVEASPIWANGTYGKPTAIPGTGIFIGTGTAAVPVVPIETALPLGTGIPLITGTGVLLATGTGSLVLPTDLASPLYPNTTTVSAEILPFPVLVTGVPAVLVNLTAPTANITTVTPTASFTQIPILVTGTPNGVLINVTLTPPANETLVAPVNATASTTSTVEAAASLTELPFTVTGAPGAVLNVSVTIPSGPFVNVSSTEIPAIITSIVSVGTGLPIPSINATAALFTNSTTTTVASPATVVPSAGTLSFVFPPLDGGNYMA